jgi:hypothetical protein
VTVTRLQVQRLPLKPGDRGARIYDPSPVTVVDALEVGPRGCVGILDGERILDTHHADHPQTRNRDLDNGLSLLTVTALAALRSTYGAHVVPGESLLVDELPPGDLLLETDGEALLLEQVLPAPPCVEFSRYCLGIAPPSLDGVQETLRALDDGARGFYARVCGAGTVRVGARIWPR